MKSVNFVVLGDSSIAGELGKKGSSADMTFYERKLSDTIFSFIAPSGFPKKVQPLIQAIALAEYAIVNVTAIDRVLGEQIVALNALRMDRGFIVAANGLDDDVKKIVRSTVLDKYEFITLDNLKRKLDSVAETGVTGATKIVVDAAFEVKGIGPVALGVVRRGLLKKHDELVVYPEVKPVSVRSIQMHDEDVDEAVSPARVGVALKGVTADEIERGNVIAAKDSLKTGSELKIKFEKSPFYKGEINSSSSYHLSIDLQAKPVKLKLEGDDLTVAADKPFAYEPGDSCLILDLDAPMRIVGRGVIL
ncbi:MAG: EF-Tu/IF-2/RF-3 family GTPase [Thaumarchaeota archaeon]|nr:EF-Tu/IF-2/RF-3 family GTPase [Nitrososphaerota archaeon]